MESSKFILRERIERMCRGAVFPVEAEAQGRGTHQLTPVLGCRVGVGDLVIKDRIVMLSYEY